MVQIVLVEPDVAGADAMIGRLTRHGYEIDRVGSGQEALSAYEHADLVLLELDLPDLDGVEVCRHIRANSNTPIITFTADEAHVDRVLSLHAGADDSIVKPFEFRELVARMKAVLRRAVPAPAAETVAISHGALHIDPRKREVRVGERVVDVTRKEFDLLYLLASQPDAVVSRKELMSKVWADEWGTRSRTVDTHVSSLRNKLGDGDWIVTVRGVGYRLGRDAIPQLPGRESMEHMTAGTDLVEMVSANRHTDASSPITMINVFEIAPEDLGIFIDGWRERVKIMQSKPGFLCARLHRALSDDARFQLINIAHWTSLSAYHDARGDPEFQSRIRAVLTGQSIEVTATPALYQVILEQEP